MFTITLKILSPSISAFEVLRALPLGNLFSGSYFMKNLVETLSSGVLPRNKIATVIVHKIRRLGFELVHIGVSAFRSFTY